jgi:hypothetical protein
VEKGGVVADLNNELHTVSAQWQAAEHELEKERRKERELGQSLEESADNLKQLAGIF